MDLSGQTLTPANLASMEQPKVPSLSRLDWPQSHLNAFWKRQMFLPLYGRVKSHFLFINRFLLYYIKGKVYSIPINGILNLLVVEQLQIFLTFDTGWR